MPTKPGTPYTYTGSTSRETIGARRRTHGLTHTREYRIWNNMKTRCLNPKTRCYHNYGGRGITICESWLSFDNFFSDMGMCPDGLTLERKNTNLGYCKDNCEWATVRHQQNNRTNNFTITYLDQTLTASEWSRRTGIPMDTLKQRALRGLDMDQVFSTMRLRGPKSKPCGSYGKRNK
jgi:hypothetical protein